MSKPLQFIIEKDGKLMLNEEVMTLIKNAVEPRFILFYGKTRLGKSTTLNQLIRGNKETWKYNNKSPFNSNNTLESVTKGCDIFGPIKITELMKRHNLKTPKIKKDFDVFFCDTEGISSLDGIQKSSISGILTLLQICTISVFMVNKTCSTQDVKEICSQIHISKLLKKISCSPIVTVYISSIFTGKKDEGEEEAKDDEEDDEVDIDTAKQRYFESEQIEKQRIYDEAKKKYPDLNLLITDFEVIAGGPYHDIKKEPDHEDTDAQLYWCSIKKILTVFLNNREKGYKIDKIPLINILFETFSEIPAINDDFNLDTFLKTYLSKKFDEKTKEKFVLKLKKIKEEIITNFLEYMNILNDDNKAKESIKKCIEEEFIDIYSKLIPDKVNSFIDLSLEQYRKTIKEQLDNEFDSISENIISESNINSLIKDILEIINKAEFKEDIDMKIINDTDKFWNDMYEKNKLILNYFKETKSGILEQLKENFISRINAIFQDLLSKKNSWSNYLKDSLISIQKDINKNYSEMLNKCNYQEDIEIYITKDDKYYEEILPSIIDKYFKNISETRLNEVKEILKKIIKDEYEKVVQNKLPIWKNIKQDISSRIKEIIESYLSKIFNQKEFKDDIDPNMGRKDNILKIIPSEIKENSQIKNNKKDEINKLIDNEIENAVKIFNTKRESLPLLNESIGNKIKICSKIVDDKIKDIIQKFNYIEDKIIFNSDSIFSLLTNNQEIYKNCGSKIKEMNIKIRELCDEKSHEYDLLVQRIKPEWNKIKTEKISKMNDICSNYIKKILENADYQEDIKAIDTDNLKKEIIESPDFYKSVENNKKEELNSEIEKIIQKTSDKINNQKNNLQNWNIIKSQLIQQAYIEMTNKSKTNLGTTNLEQAINILSQHIETIPKFFDPCKTESKKNEIRNEIKNNAKPIAVEYINKKEEEIRRKKEEEERERKYQQMLREAEERQREAQRAYERERRLREEEENRRRREEENRRRREEEDRRRRDDENRRRREEEDRRRREEEDRRRREDEHRRHIDDLANRVLRGEFGSGKTRENRLGHLFKEVQNKVNEKLGCSFRYKI